MQLIPDATAAKRGQKMEGCPKASHFHAFISDVFELQNFSFRIECATPNDALDGIVDWLADDWEGSIEIDSDKTNSLRKAPLIDFWRASLRK